MTNISIAHPRLSHMHVITNTALHTSRMYRGSLLDSYTHWERPRKYSEGDLDLAGIWLELPEVAEDILANVL